MRSVRWGAAALDGHTCAQLPALRVELDDLCSRRQLGRALVSAEGTIRLPQVGRRWAGAMLRFSVYSGQTLLWQGPVQTARLSRLARGPCALSSVTGSIVYGWIHTPTGEPVSGALLKLYTIEGDEGACWLHRLGSTVSSAQGFYWLRSARCAAPDTLLRARAFSAAHRFLGSTVTPFASVCRVDLQVTEGQAVH